MRRRKRSLEARSDPEPSMPSSATTWKATYSSGPSDTEAGNAPAAACAWSARST